LCGIIKYVIKEEIMGYIDEIAYNVGERSEVPNQELARKLVGENSAEGIKEIASYLYDKNKSVASDCIKVLYEAGYIKPELIAPYTDTFIELLSSKQNRMVWGAMIALSGCAKVVPEKVYEHKDLILEKIATGSVITNVWGVKTLINIVKTDGEYYPKLRLALFELQKTYRPVNFAKLAEDMMDAIAKEDIEKYIDILESGKIRLSAGGVKRTDRVIKKLHKKLNS
jgi:hypothetical protein